MTTSKRLDDTSLDSVVGGSVKPLPLPFPFPFPHPHPFPFPFPLPLPKPHFPL